MIRSLAAVLVAGAVHVTAILVGDRPDLTAETLTTIIWIVLVVWLLGLFLILSSVVQTGRGLFLLGKEAWLRLALTIVAGAAGGFAGLWLGRRLQELSDSIRQTCLAIAQPIPFNCPSEWLIQWTPWMVMIALGGLAWTLAASRR